MEHVTICSHYGSSIWRARFWLLPRPCFACRFFSAMPISNLTKHLVWLFGKGDISGSRLQKLAHAAVSDQVYDRDDC